MHVSGVTVSLNVEVTILTSFATTEAFTFCVGLALLVPVNKTKGVLARLDK